MGSAGALRSIFEKMNESRASGATTEDETPRAGASEQVVEQGTIQASQTQEKVMDTTEVVEPQAPLSAVRSPVGRTVYAVSESETLTQHTSG